MTFPIFTALWPLQNGMRFEHAVQGTEPLKPKAT